MPNSEGKGDLSKRNGFVNRGDGTRDTTPDLTSLSTVRPGDRVGVAVEVVGSRFTVSPGWFDRKSRSVVRDTGTRRGQTSGDRSHVDGCLGSLLIHRTSRGQRGEGLWGKGRVV